MVPTTRAAFLLATLGLLVGCQAEPEILQLRVQESFGTIVGDGLYLVPSHHWTVTEDRHWSFGSGGEMLVHVQETPGEDLTVEFRAGMATRGYRSRVYWRGEEWKTGSPTFGESLRVTIPSSALEIGTHRLSIQRDYPWDRRNVPGAQPETRFRYLGYQLGDQSRALRVEDRERFHFLREFLELGGTGIEREILGGVLLDGEGEVDLVAERSGHLDMILQNLGHGGVEFSIKAPGFASSERLEQGRRVSLRVPLDSGSAARLTARDTQGLTLAGGLHFTASGPESPAPSIVLVTLDTTRRDFVAPYSPSASTPNLLAFSRQATVFDNAQATSPWTVPSHASIFTGLWPSQHGAGLYQRGLASSFQTLTERLRAEGYFTAGFSGGALTHHQYGLAQGMHRYRNPDGHETTGEQLTGYVEGVLDETTSRPLFLFVNYFDSHAAYNAPQRFEERFGVAEAGDHLAGRDVWSRLVAGDSSVLADAIKGRGGFGAEVERYLERAYRAEVAYMDEQLGLLFERLKQDGLWDGAMVIVVADHGEMLAERGLFTHGHWLEPELVDIPLIIKWPGQTRGAHVRTPVSQIDLFPTILRAAGSRVPSDQRGIPLYPFEEPLATSRLLLFEEHESPGAHPLFADVRVAKNLFGARVQDLRVTAWEDQLRCQQFVEGVWMEIDCPPQAPTKGLIEDAIGGTERRIDGVSELSEAEEQMLRALGYL